MKLSEIDEYFNPTPNDLNDPMLLNNMQKGIDCFLKHIENEDRVLIIVDSDADGYTSSALLLNWMYEQWPIQVLQRTDYIMHDGKEHGMVDIDCSGYDLVIIPDAGSNDYEYHKAWAAGGIDILVLDHHEAEHESEDAIIINNQMSENYPNKSLSGVGVVYKFCLAVDRQKGKIRIDKYLDLVALGLISDMMDMRNKETHYLTMLGLKNITNPYFYSMCQKNAFSIGSEVTPHGVAWYITPFINAHVRSGTQKEKETLFKSMLSFNAFQTVPSTKRGHKAGDLETIVDQACRNSTNVKKRQTTIQDNMMSQLEGEIIAKNMMDNKVLLFLEPVGTIDRNVAGLIANKIMGKYQRPVAVLSKVGDIYEGSARGCDLVGVTNFKDICEESESIVYAEGHQGAFGLGIKVEDIDTFLTNTNTLLKDMSDEPVYYVDYIFSGQAVLPNTVLNLGGMKSVWAQNIPEPQIAIQNLKVNNENCQLLSPDKHPTLKITLNNGIELMKFGFTQDEFNELTKDAGKIIDIVGTCEVNEWMGNKRPQLKIIEYAVSKNLKWDF